MKRETTVTEVKNDLLSQSYLKCSHKSGLDIYIIKNSFASVQATFVTKYGSIDSRFKKKSEKEFTVVPDGIAHFLEHKMFENQDGEDSFEKYAKAGANANAYTTFNHTAYYFGTAGDWKSALETLLSTVTSPYFTEETVEKEQGIIAQEIKMGEDNPGQTLFYGMLRAAYQKNNIRKEVAGSVESIKEITADLLYRCYDIFYNLRNMMLIISGNVDEKAVIEIADRTLKEAPEFDIVSENEEEPEDVCEKRFTAKRQVSTPLFSVCVKNVKIDKDPFARMRDALKLQIATELILGQAGEFNNYLYDNGIVNSANAFYSHSSSFSFVEFSGEAPDPERVYEEYRKHIEKTVKEGITKEDFLRRKRAVFAQMIKSFDSSEGSAEFLLDTLLDGLTPFYAVEALNEITKDDVNEFIKSFFAENRTAYADVYPLGE